MRFDAPVSTDDGSRRPTPVSKETYSSVKRDQSGREGDCVKEGGEEKGSARGSVHWSGYDAARLNRNDSDRSPGGPVEKEAGRTEMF
jgi:hypothetical protein